MNKDLKKRAILIIPEFVNLFEIEEVRKQYDPLYAKIAPHITVVFPFESTMSHDEVLQHVKNATKHCRHFTLHMGGYTGYDNEYLFLNVIRGNDEIIDLHQRLYSGILEQYHEPLYTFLPHMTVGRLSNQADFFEALEKMRKRDTVFETEVKQITIKVIDGNEYGWIEAKVPILETI